MNNFHIAIMVAGISTVVVFCFIGLICSLDLHFNRTHHCRTYDFKDMQNYQEKKMRDDTITIPQFIPTKNQRTIKCRDSTYPTKTDTINHPPHYIKHPSGIECIDITRHMGFNLGNAIKYIWRSDLKHNDGGVEDLQKAIFYLNDQIELLKQKE